MKLNENLFTDYGYKNRDEYLKNLANEYNVDYSIVKQIADILGQDEDFDGLVTAIEDGYLNQKSFDNEKQDNTKQFNICIYKDNNFTEKDKCYEINWGDTIDGKDWEDWCYEQLSNGKSIILRDTKNKDILYYKYDENHGNKKFGHIDDFIYDAREMTEDVAKISDGPVDWIGFEKNDNDKIIIDTKGYWTYVIHQIDSFSQAIVGYIFDRKYYENDKDYFITKDRIDSHKYATIRVDNGTNHKYIVQTGIMSNGHGVDTIDDGVEYILNKKNLTDKKLKEDIDIISYNDFLADNFVGWPDADEGFDDLIKLLNSFARTVLHTKADKLIFVNAEEIYPCGEKQLTFKNEIDVYYCKYCDCTYGVYDNIFIFKNERDAEFIMQQCDEENLSEDINKNSPKRDIENLLKSIGVSITDCNAYGWCNTNIDGLYFNKDDHWSGWFNDYYNYGTLFIKDPRKKDMLSRIIDKLRDNGLDLKQCYPAGKYFGYSIGFSTMTKKEVDDKAYNNLINGGRMSDSLERKNKNQIDECSFTEDTIKKRNGKWTNKGDSGETHGEFRTKKAADAQRRAMFANGYKG